MAEREPVKMAGPIKPEPKTGIRFKVKKPGHGAPAAPDTFRFRDLQASPLRRGSAVWTGQLRGRIPAPEAEPAGAKKIRRLLRPGFLCRAGWEAFGTRQAILPTFSRRSYSSGTSFTMVVRTIQASRYPAAIALRWYSSASKRRSKSPIRTL